MTDASNRAQARWNRLQDLMLPVVSAFLEVLQKTLGHSKFRIIVIIGRADDEDKTHVYAFSNATAAEKDALMTSYYAHQAETERRGPDSTPLH